MSRHDGDPLQVEVWSDIMCRFCYMGCTLLARAVEQFQQGRDVAVRYRSYQLMPHLRADRGVGLDELLEKERGLPRARAAAENVLGTGAFDAAVDDDLRRAAQLGITGVPFFVLDGRFAVSGAQPVEVLLRALDTAGRTASARWSGPA